MCDVVLVKSYIANKNELTRFRKLSLENQVETLVYIINRIIHSYLQTIEFIFLCSNWTSHSLHRVSSLARYKLEYSKVYSAPPRSHVLLGEK